ncbi:uncharacterized protein UDID_17764 [Ustilago sp. UG-2017a]|nr:uncharacterized protein UDID_17764 [Ustilago sp. UG-2017a]
MTTTTDDSLDISAQLFWQPAAPTSSATQTRNIPALSQSGSTSAPDIYTSCPNQVSGSATGKKDFTWSSADVLHLVTIIYDRDLQVDFPRCTCRAQSHQGQAEVGARDILQGEEEAFTHWSWYTAEDMDASNPSYASGLALSTKYAWFEKMHKMMNGQSSAEPATLIMTPSLNFTSDDKAGMPPYGSAGIPMELSGSKLYDHGAHGHGLPPILNLMDSTNPPAAIASTSGGSVAGAGDNDIFTMPFPSQARLSFSTAGGLDVFESSSSPSSAPLSPGTKCKRGALDHKCNTLAETRTHHSIFLPCSITCTIIQSQCKYTLQPFCNALIAILPLHAPSPSSFLLLLLLPAMQTEAFQWNYSSSVAGLLELNNDVMQFALEGERQHAAAWVRNTTGVEEWGKGWLVVNGTHIPLAWKPGVHSQEHFCYKGFHSINVALVILPHSLWIVKSVVGQPGSIQDSKVWASGSNILKKPCLYLDKDAQDLRRTRCSNQQEYELNLATATQGMLQYALSRLQSSAAHDLQEEMFQSLFRSTGHNEEDATALSQHHEKTTADYNAMTQSASAWRQLGGVGMNVVSWAGMLGKQEGTSREHGRSAVSMETMDSYGFTCKGGAGPYARRARQEEDQAQGACRWLPLRGSRDKSQRNHHRSKEEEQCIGDRQVGPEEEEQCRRSRHCSGGTGVPSKEEEQCRRSRHSSGGQEWC